MLRKINLKERTRSEIDP